MALRTILEGSTLRGYTRDNLPVFSKNNRLFMLYCGTGVVDIDYDITGEDVMRFSGTIETPGPLDIPDFLGLAVVSVVYRVNGRPVLMITESDPAGSYAALICTPPPE